MRLTYQIIAALADGRFHSGQQLGAALGVSRAAVCKAVQHCAQLGLNIHAVSGKGYCLAHSLELLDKATLTSQLHQDTQALIASLDVFPSIDSTSQYLLSSARQLNEQAEVCLAEHQTQGRGRRGNQWESPYGVNIYLSIRWRFNAGPAQVSGLSLALGVLLVRVLQRLGAEELSLKWPNDILFQQRKVAGILIDVNGEAHGPCTLVAGMGINLGLQHNHAANIRQPWDNICFRHGVSRNQLVAALLNELLPCLQHYPATGLAAYRAAWQQLDAFSDAGVTLHTAAGDVQGIARGIAEDGSLCVEVDGHLRHYASAEVSLRRCEA